jgi:membrane protein implicated in regulation of membrane protease activity
MARGVRTVSPELWYTILCLIMLGITMVIPGGRVLVLPVMFALMLVLLYWAAKPRRKETDRG